MKFLNPALKYSDSEYAQYFLHCLKEAHVLRQIAEYLAENRPNSQDYFLAAGCVVQNIWNHLTARPLGYGILDYDIVFFSPEAPFDWAQELEYMLQKQFPGLKFDVKNQAHVHLWFEKKFGLHLTPYHSLDAAIATWPSTATATALQCSSPSHELHWNWQAPFGLKDLLTGVVRPVKTLVSEEIYARKAQRWQRLWPELTVLSFDQGLGPFEINRPIDLPPI